MDHWGKNWNHQGPHAYKNIIKFALEKISNLLDLLFMEKICGSMLLSLLATVDSPFSILSGGPCIGAEDGPPTAAADTSVMVAGGMFSALSGGL